MLLQKQSKLQIPPDSYRDKFHNMIQRKQSLWLLVAALLNAGVFLFDYYKYQTTVLKQLLDKQVPVANPGSLRVSNDFLLMLVALVMILLPLVTIFMFKKRKQQILMTYVSILAVIAFTGIVLMRVNSIAKNAIIAGSESYSIGVVLPVISLVFMVLAIIGIRKDDKLVKSVDRLR